MIPLILSVLLIAVGISFFSSVVAGLIPSTTSKKTKNTKIKKLISNSLPSGGQLEPNDSIHSQDGSYILKNEGNRLVLIGPEGEVVKEWPYVSGDPILSVSDKGDISYGETIIHQGTSLEDNYSLEVTNDGNLELSNGNGSEFIGLKWTRLGGDIDGVLPDDRSGRSVSLSSDGKIVAIGAPLNNSFQGIVSIYQYNKNNENNWTQLGGDIYGEGDYNESGYSVSLSSDGKIVAIGAPYNTNVNGGSGHVKVYKYTEVDGWTQLGGDIVGEAAGDESGYSVSLSSDGKIVAIGAPFNTNVNGGSGHVRVYEYINGSWTQLGGDIDGAANDYSGFSVSLSNNGKIVAIGALYNDNANGHVRVFEYKEDENKWTQLGPEILGAAPGDQSGYSVSLSENGKIVAIGAPWNDNGHVRVFEYKEDENKWTQLGPEILGAAPGDRSGYSVSLSSDGNIVAIGAPRFINNRGIVRVFQYNGTVWTQLGGDIDGEAGFDESGYSVSLSSDGKIVAIGAPGNDNANGRSGHVRVYKTNLI